MSVSTRRGASILEYGVILALIAAGVTFALAGTGTKVACTYTRSAVSVDAGVTAPTSVCTGGYIPPQWSSQGTQNGPLSLQAGTDGQAYNASIPSARTFDGSAVSYAIVSNTLPNGLSFNTATGAISGTPSSNPAAPGVTATIGVQAIDGHGDKSVISFLTVPINGHVVFAYTGSDQTFSMPVGAVTFKLWGAGGGGNSDGRSYGGAGGFTIGTLSYNVGQTVTVMVGQGGALVSAAASGTYGGGGNRTIGKNTNRSGGIGGGRSAILLSGSDALVAGGGGGAGSSASAVLYAGAGGGNNGQAAGPTAGWSNLQDGGTGGSQTAGGQPLNYPGSGDSSSVVGSIDQGGTAAYFDDSGNGSGGGGYYGGGAGSDDGNGAGGGGSSYLGNAQNASSTAGSNATPANTGDSDYQSGVGIGGVPTGSAHSGGNGLVVATWPP